MTIDTSKEMRAKVDAAVAENLAAGDWVAPDPFLDINDPPLETQESWDEVLHPRGRGGKWIKRLGTSQTRTAIIDSHSRNDPGARTGPWYSWPEGPGTMEREPPAEGTHSLGPALLHLPGTTKAIQLQAMTPEQEQTTRVALGRSLNGIDPKIIDRLPSVTATTNGLGNAAADFTNPPSGGPVYQDDPDWMPPEANRIRIRPSMFTPDGQSAAEHSLASGFWSPDGNAADGADRALTHEVGHFLDFNMTEDQRTEVRSVLRKQYKLTPKSAGALAGSAGPVRIKDLKEGDTYRNDTGAIYKVLGVKHPGTQDMEVTVTRMNHEGHDQPGLLTGDLKRPSGGDYGKFFPLTFTDRDGIPGGNKMDLMPPGWDPSQETPKYNVSKYASKNSDELIAELWAEYMTSPNPRDAARFVGEYIQHALAGPQGHLFEADGDD